MTQLEITKKSFLEWYFEHGSDKEIKDTKLTFAEKVITALKNDGKVELRVDAMLNDCNKDDIHLVFCEGYNVAIFDDIILADIGGYELHLID